MEQIGIHDMKASDLVPMQDVWMHRPEPWVMQAYRLITQGGLITKPRMTVSRATGICIMSYASVEPREWIRDALRQVSKDVKEDFYEKEDFYDHSTGNQASEDVCQ